MAERDKQDGNQRRQRRKRRRGKKKRGIGTPSKRSIHRARSHETSQAEAERATPADIPEHPLIPAGAPEIIETDRELAELLEHLRRVGRFAYDTEFIGELSYYPKICLIQLATHERVALVDPLSRLDLDGIWALVVDADIETLVHAGGQDFEPVVRLHGAIPRNTFDTQVAAGFTGFSYPLGLGRLVDEILGIKLGKGLTFTHWDHRPLSEVHARYAADDVRFLPALHDVLRGKLEDRGHTSWAADECASIAEAAAHERDPETLYRRVKGMHQLRPRKLAVLRELTKLREDAARNHDVPPRSLVKDGVLLDLARNPVKSVQKLGKVPGLSKRVAQAYGEAIVKATREALELPKDLLPGRPDFVKESPGDQVRIDALNSLAASLCYARQIAPSLAVNRKDIAQLYSARGRGRDVEACRLMHGWRSDLIGRPMIDILDGRASMSVSWSGGRMHAQVDRRDGKP